MDEALAGAHWSRKSCQRCFGLLWLWVQTGVGHGHCACVDAGGGGQGCGLALALPPALRLAAGIFQVSVRAW